MATTTFDDIFNKKFKFIAITINNYCNLHCKYCNNFCDQGIRKTNKNIFMRTTFDIDINDIIKYCQKLVGIGEDNWHRLSGGEPTLMGNTLFSQIVDILFFYGRRIDLLTNGYNLLSLDSTLLNKISRITLDDHNVNSDLIVKCLEYLNSSFNGEVNLLKQQYHYNLVEAQKSECNRGKTCDNWISTLGLYKKVIFPCCVLYPLMLYRNDYTLYDSLYKAGWCIDNSTLVDTIKNYQYTIPDVIINECLYNCWNPDFSSATKVLIE